MTCKMRAKGGGVHKAGDSRLRLFPALGIKEQNGGQPEDLQML